MSDYIFDKDKDDGFTLMVWGQKQLANSIKIFATYFRLQTS